MTETTNLNTRARRHEGSGLPASVYAPLSEREEALASEIVDAAYSVHVQLGPGLLESVYETCFCYELERRHIPFQRQIEVPILYRDLVLDGGLRLDVMVDDLIVCELKAAAEFHPVWEAQLTTYLRLCHKRLGFLINFTVPRMKDGIRRFIL